MAHKLRRLINSKINNKPLLATQDQLESVLDYLENRQEASIGNQEEYREYNEVDVENGIAFLNIAGSLVYEQNWLTALCEITSYQGLEQKAEDAFSKGAKILVLDLDSGGGEAYACFETANRVRRMADKEGATILAYVDGMAASGGYVWASIADELIINPMADVGSIGVVMRLMDTSEKMKKEGVKPIFITSTDTKVPYNPDGSFREGFLEDLREGVIDTHNMFVEHVTKYRDISADKLNEIGSRMFTGEKAVKLGLADKTMEHEDFFEYLAQLTEGSAKVPLSSFFKRSAKANKESQQAAVEDVTASLEAQEVDVDESQSLATTTQQEEIEMSELAELQAKLSEMEAAGATLGATNLELTTKLQQMQEDLQAANTLIAEMKQEKQQAATEAKKARLSAVVGDTEADKLFTALSALDDSAFDVVIASYEAKNQALANDPAFKEVGVDADAKGAHEELDVDEQLVADLKAKKEAAKTKSA